jgi:uncharacterized membrane protein
LHSTDLTRNRIVDFKWDKRAGPVLFITVGKRKLGLALLCHRLPDRSFTIFGYKSPLCSRCTGLLIGFLGFIGLVVFQVHIPLFAAVLLMLPMLIDGISQLFDFRESNNALRLFTGLIFTLALTSLLVK